MAEEHTEHDRQGARAQVDGRGRALGRGRLRLGLFLNIPVREVDGELTARYPHLFDFFMALAERTSRTYLCVPTSREPTRRPDYGTVPTAPNVELVPLPHWSSAPKLVRRAHRVIPAAMRVAVVRGAEWDVVGAVAPSLVGTLVVSAARLRRRPVFLLVRGEKQRTVTLIMGPGLRTRAYVWALRAMELPVRRWVRVGVPTFVAGDELVDRYRAPGARLFNLYPGLSRNFPVLDAPRGAVDVAGPVGRAGTRGLRLICVGRLSPEKGIEDLLVALAAAVRSGAELELTLVGDGPEAERLRERAAAVSVGDRVHFAGFVPHGPELVRLLDGADVFVLPSHSEGLPHSVVEAMARGLPIVATEIGGLPRLLSDGTGILVAPGDVDGLAAVLLKLARGDVDLAQLSTRSLAAARRFAPEAQVTEMCAHLADAYPALRGMVDG